MRPHSNQAELISHFYHVYADGAWPAPVREHTNALLATGLGDRIGHCEVTIIAADPADQHRAQDAIRARFLDAGCRVARFTTATAGHEQLTLRRVRSWARADPGCTFYAHTKGAYTVHPLNDAWRRSMTRHLVWRWRECVQLLATHDTVGCHLITTGTVSPDGHTVKAPFYGGNFWWANNTHLRRLPPPANRSRYDAEAWLAPTAKAYDLNPGWPEVKLFSLFQEPK